MANFINTVFELMKIFVSQFKTIAAVASYFLIVADFSRSTAAANAAEKREEAAKAAAAAAMGNLATTTMAPTTMS